MKILLLFCNILLMPIMIFFLFFINGCLIKDDESVKDYNKEVNYDVFIADEYKSLNNNECTLYTDIIEEKFPQYFENNEIKNWYDYRELYEDEVYISGTFNWRTLIDGYYVDIVIFKVNVRTLKAQVVCEIKDVKSGNEDDELSNYYVYMYLMDKDIFLYTEATSVNVIRLSDSSIIYEKKNVDHNDIDDVNGIDATYKDFYIFRENTLEYQEYVNGQIKTHIVSFSHDTQIYRFKNYIYSDGYEITDFAYDLEKEEFVDYESVIKKVNDYKNSENEIIYTNDLNNSYRLKLELVA